MKKAIEKDIMLKTFGNIIENFSHDGKRLRPKDVVYEFENYLHDELDLIREG